MESTIYSYLKQSMSNKKTYQPLIAEGKEYILIDGEYILINSNQKWFWSGEWQKRHKKAIHELESGEYEEFRNGEDFLNSLKNL